MEPCLQRAARSTQTCFVDSGRLGAPRAARKWSILICSYPSCQGHQPDYPDANRGVVICLRGLDPSLGTAQTSNVDATDARTRPIPPSPDLWEIRILWGWSGVWKCAENGSGRTERLQPEPPPKKTKNRFGDFFRGVKGLRRFMYFLYEVKFGFPPPPSPHSSLSEMWLCFNFHALEPVSISSDLLE